MTEHRSPPGGHAASPRGAVAISVGVVTVVGVGIHVQDKQTRSRGFGVVAVLAVVGLAAVTLLAGRMFGFIDFGTTQVDNSPPPLLVKLSDLSEYHAATSNYEEIVDLEKDVSFLPSFVAGERSTMVAAGTVDATVDFSKLTAANIDTSPDRKSVTIQLPAPTLAAPRIDNNRTQVVARQRGILNRIGGVFSDQPVNDQQLYQIAETKLSAAAEQSGLRELAQKNTTEMLTTLLRSLGFDNITITYVAPVTSS